MTLLEKIRLLRRDMNSQPLTFRANTLPIKQQGVHSFHSNFIYSDNTLTKSLPTLPATRHNASANFLGKTLQAPLSLTIAISPRTSNSWCVDSERFIVFLCFLGPVVFNKFIPVDWSLREFHYQWRRGRGSCHCLSPSFFVKVASSSGVFGDVITHLTPYVGQNWPQHCHPSGQPVLHPSIDIIYEINRSFHTTSHIIWRWEGETHKHVTTKLLWTLKNYYGKKDNNK